MGLRFTVPFSNVASGAVADTFVTLAAIVAGDTAGTRARLRSLQIGPADDAPQSIDLAVRVNRIDDLSGGSAGTPGATPTPAQKDSLSRAAVCTAGTAYSGEPSTYLTVPLWEVGMNAMNSLIKEWGEEDAPVANRDQVLGLLVAPRSAVAATLSGVLEFEEF